MPKDTTNKRPRRNSLRAISNPLALRKLFSKSKRRKSDSQQLSQDKQQRQDPVVETSSQLPHSHSRPPGCIAILNDDFEEDAVVVTALYSVPFCCHEDLLDMSREEILEVATSLNAKLPMALAVDLEDGTTAIRRKIEALVGIKRTAKTPSPSLEEVRPVILDYGLAARGKPTLSLLEEDEDEEDSLDLGLDSETDSLFSSSPPALKMLASTSTVLDSPTPRPRVRNRAPLVGHS